MIEFVWGARIGVLMIWMLLLVKIASNMLVTWSLDRGSRM
jgi:hypothetical protein